MWLLKIDAYVGGLSVYEMMRRAHYVHVVSSCNTQQHTAVHCSTLQQCVAVYYSVLQCTVLQCTVLLTATLAQHVAHCNTLHNTQRQHSAQHTTCCSLKHSAQHSLQHPAQQSTLCTTHNVLQSTLCTTHNVNTLHNTQRVAHCNTLHNTHCNTLHNRGGHE